MSVLTEIGSQVPALAVLVYVVMVFLRHMASFSNKIENMNEVMIVSINKNTEAIGANTEVKRRMIELVESSSGCMGAVSGHCQSQADNGRKDKKGN